jgi:SAM-dependent methyltransferase
MSDWTAGYMAEIGYTFGYYSELNPLRIKMAFLNSGLSFPEIGTACELGFGQGMSTNIHAAASLTQWYGTDFNPAQAGFAQELAGVSNSGAKLYDESFSEFAQRSDLPDFDYIGLHGIWSWISDENRNVIVDFIRRKLKVGGVLYISYNTLPGWAAFAPMRHLMAEHAEVNGAKGRGIVSKVDDAIDFADKLMATNPIYARANPQIAERINKLKGQDRQYLAHEYFNQHWHPMHFATIVDWLHAAKLNYACSAHYPDHIEGLNLSPEQQAFLKEIPDPMFRESVRDFMVNQQFRRDYWVKGSRKMSLIEQTEKIRAQKVVLQSYRPDISLKVLGCLGEAEMHAAIYNPVLDFLSDHKVRTVAQIEQYMQDKGASLSQVIEIVMVLIGAGHLAPAQDEGIAAKAKKHSDRLNSYLCNRARGVNEISKLASPVTGGSVSVNRFQQLFLLEIMSGRSQPSEWVDAVWRTLRQQKQRIVKEGKTMESEEDNLAQLRAWADEFKAKQVPILKALQVI